MADKRLSSEEWIRQQNEDRKEREKSARQKAEEMTKGTRANENLDTGNKVILEATIKNLELTDEAHRDDDWHREYDKTQTQLAEIEAAERTGRA